MYTLSNSSLVYLDEERHAGRKVSHLLVQALLELLYNILKQTLSVVRAALQVQTIHSNVYCVVVNSSIHFKELNLVHCFHNTVFIKSLLCSSSLTSSRYFCLNISFHKFSPLFAHFLYDETKFTNKITKSSSSKCCPCIVSPKA